MTEPVYFHTMAIQLPREAVYRRLGYRPEITHVSREQQQQTEAYIEEAGRLVALQGAYRVVEVAHKDEHAVSIGSGARLESHAVASFLGECRSMVFMGATAGSAVMSAIQDCIARERVSAAAVYDAVASEMVDSALDWLMRYVDTQLRRQNLFLMRKRFSCGYGDFALSHQRIFYELLRLDALDVQINEHYILTPEKSVTALTGIMSSSISGAGESGGK